MWFFSAPTYLRTPTARSQRGTFRPRLEALEDRCLLSAGALDTTFGSGGLVLGPNVPNATNAVIQAVVVQTDGKIVTGGHIVVNALSQFALERYNADGTPDSSFGISGAVQTTVGAGYGDGISGLALQSDGKIVAVGSAAYSLQPVVDQEFAVARYNANGSLDTTFGSNHNGIVTTNVVTATYSNVGIDWAKAVAIQGDGKIVVAGISQAGPPTSNSTKFTFIRYNKDGTLDTTFGSRKNPGIVITPTFGNLGDSADALAVQSDGKIVLAGYIGNTVSSPGAAMAVARYTSTGTLDSSFGNNGIAMVAPSGATALAFGVLVQSNGAIVVAGDSYAGTSTILAVARLTSTGHLDTSFGNSGFAVNSFMVAANAIAQGANGDLVAAGFTQKVPSYDFGVTAFLPGGTLDTTFGTGGTTTANFSGINDRAFATAIQGDGKIVAAGFSLPPGGQPEFALARFLPPNTKIGTLTASQLAAGSAVTLTASNIMNSNPTSYIAQVSFYYLDSSNNVVPLGTVTSQSTQISYSLITSLAPGSYTLYAVATDSNGGLSDPLALSLQVI